MTIREQIKQEIDHLSEEQLSQVNDFIAFIKFRNRRVLDERQLADLYNESAEEDQELAEIGMSNYREMLQQEDIR